MNPAVPDVERKPSYKLASTHYNFNDFFVSFLLGFSKDFVTVSHKKYLKFSYVPEITLVRLPETRIHEQCLRSWCFLHNHITSNGFE